jgi:hypothetical protein
MRRATLLGAMNPDLGRLLAAHQVALSQPRPHLLVLDAVPVGAGFSKPCTNVLLCERPPSAAWRAYVDDDLRYQGPDPARRAMLVGPSRRGWRELAAGPIEGNVNQAILWTLQRLDSAIPGPAAEAGEFIGSKGRDGADERADGRTASAGERGAQAFRSSAAATLSAGNQSLDDEIQRVGRRFDLARLRPAGLVPSASQEEAIGRVAECAGRDAAPRAALLIGPSGVGKTTVARLAAGELVRRGAAEQVIEVQGAAVASGAIFWPERDERLRQALEAILTGPTSVVILEQFDLVLVQSEVAGSLVADAIDRGLMLVAVARPAAARASLKRQPALRRRLEPVAIRPPAPEELARIIRQRAHGHPLAGCVELAPAVLPLVASLSRRRPGANPGAALGLLEAAIHGAAFAGRACVGPDSIYHLTARKEPS